MKKILITGTNSFIGKSFIQAVDKFELDFEVEKISLRNDDWKSKSFHNYDVIIHAAALVHQSEKNSNYKVYDKVNHQLTIELAIKAKEEGVKQFIFLSTMSVYGLSVGHITENTPINPLSFYARSKALAEQSLIELNTEKYRVAIIRPPMVYGVNNKGNFSTLNKIALFTPIFPKINNERSAIYVGNLCEFIRLVIEENLQGLLFPQNSEYMMTSSTVAMLGEVNLKKVHVSKILGLAIKPFMISTTVQKAFGSLTYDISLPGGPKQFAYNKWSFKESIGQMANSTDSINDILKIWQRPLDIIFSATGIFVTSPLLLGTTLIGYFDTGSPLFIQERVGKDKKPFKLIKFRTMNVDTASVASHLADNASITKLGSLLRKTKIDELPQLINVLKGEMSLTGPRPNLFNQQELIEEREALGVYAVLPGITGLAQLSNIDMSTPQLLAKTDKQMIDNMTIKNYFSYIIRTALGKGSGDAVKEFSNG